MTCATEHSFDLGLGLEDTHVLVTGGCGLIGSIVVDAFLAAGCNVTVLDIATSNPSKSERVQYQKCDITDSTAMASAFEAAERIFGPVEACVALASLDLSVLQQSESLADMDPRQWQRVFDVNINGTFNTCQQWLRSVHRATQDAGKKAKLRNVGLIIIGSVSGRFGERTMAAYSAGKSAVQFGLLSSLAQDAPRIFYKARVNAVAPGAVDTPRYREERERYGEEFHWKECQATQVPLAHGPKTSSELTDSSTPLAKAIPAEDVARSILFLASERYSGSIHGQLLPVDGGLTGRVAWTMDELKGRGL